MVSAAPDRAHPHDAGRLTAVERLTALLDRDSAKLSDETQRRGLWVGDGTIHGIQVLAWAQETASGSATWTKGQGVRIAELIDRASGAGIPVVGLYDAMPVRAETGAAAFEGYALVTRAIAEARPHILQLAIVSGEVIGAAAMPPASADLTIQISRQSALALGDPRTAAAVTQERLDLERLGGAETHAEISGLADLVVADDLAAALAARRVIALVARRDHPTGDPADRTSPALDRLARQIGPGAAPDMIEVIEKIVDGGAFLNLGAAYAPNLLTGLATLGGRSAGIVANQPAHLAGCLDVPALNKAAGFVTLCGRLGIPILTIADCPGFLPGARQEQAGIAAQATQLAEAYAGADVPRITLVTRRLYGGAITVMAPKALGASTCLAWPEAKVSPHGPRRVSQWWRLDATPAPAADGLEQALDQAVIDRTITPHATRAAVIEALARSDA